VYVLGKIIIKQGGMSGGNYVALGGIETRKVGSPSSVRTRLTAGMNYKDFEMIEQLTMELNKLNDKLEGAQLGENADAMRSAKTDIIKKIKVIRTKWDERANAKINVFGMLYENVLITLGSSREEIKDQLSGPMSIIENTIVGGLRYISMSGLHMKAADIEEAIILQQERLSSSQPGTL
jgi:uncharacterized protein (DUF342 family)